LLLDMPFVVLLSAPFVLVFYVPRPPTPQELISIVFGLCFLAAVDAFFLWVAWTCLKEMVQWVRGR